MERVTTWKLPARWMKAGASLLTTRNSTGQNTNSATINAWYSNIANRARYRKDCQPCRPIGGLAYVLKAEETTAQYKDQKIKLKFSHQLAKVRVKLEKGSYQGNLSNATVKVKGYTSCTVMNGNVGDEGEVGYITMRKNGEYYEASLVPGTLQASEAFEISADDKNTKVNLQKAVVLEKGEVHTITITVNQNRNIDINSGSGDINITGDDEWIVYGNGNVAQRRITIDGSATVTLKNINLTNGSDGCICIKNGSPTIILEGTNKLGLKKMDVKRRYSAWKKTQISQYRETEYLKLMPILLTAVNVLASVRGIV